jgi:peptidoglycan/xylan/chitin deacetylase (PgdA/CDA1 family)
MIVLLYHLVYPRDLPHIRPLYRYKTPRAFSADLRYLRRHHRVLSHNEAMELIETGRPFPPDAVLLTFDDGYRECFTEVRPLLLEHRLPAVFFIPSELVGNRNLAYRNTVALCLARLAALDRRRQRTVMKRLEDILGRPLASREAALRAVAAPAASGGKTRERICRELEVDPRKYLERERPYLEEEEVKKLAADGFTIGGHSRFHTRLDGLGEGELEEEIFRSTRAVMEISGQTRAPFAFPFSGDRAAPEFIRRLLERQPFLTLIFGGQAAGNRRIIPRRLWADDPAGTGGKRSNLPRLLKAFGVGA